MQQRKEEREAKRLGETTVVRIIVHKPGIEKGIPIPGRRGMERDWEYPFLEMEVGDSFHVLMSKVSSSIMSTRINAYNRLHPDTRFRVRTQVNDDGERLTRVWRVK